MSEYLPSLTTAEELRDTLAWVLRRIEMMSAETKKAWFDEGVLPAAYRAIERYDMEDK